MKPLLCLFISILIGFCAPLEAKDIVEYQVGDVADADVITPVALDIVDAAATAALQAAQAQQYPFIFRGYPGVTNEMTRGFLAAFTQAHDRFQLELTNEFHTQTLDAAMIDSANFGNLVTAFGVENKNFPITEELAAEWARGNDGRDIREKMVRTLLWVEGNRICPDVMPADMLIGKMIRVVPVTDLNEKLPLGTVQRGELAPASILMTVSNVQVIFRREFAPEQQLFARAGAAFIKPNCFPDAPFTRLTRGTAVCQLVVSDHFDAGDTIVRHGGIIDAKIKADLLALNDKLKPPPPATTAPPVTAVNSRPQLPPPSTHTVTATTMQTLTSPAQTTAPASHLRHERLILALAAFSGVAFLIAGWQLWKERNRSRAAAPIAQIPLPFVEASRSDLTPQVTQAVREAVQQELTLQRRELLMAQQAATNEIASLVHRLDELQVPMQERLHTYETRIQALEKEIALRNEENRQLLKMKIEMISRQLETERAATLVPFFAAPPALAGPGSPPIE